MLSFLKAEKKRKDLSTCDSEDISTNFVQKKATAWEIMFSGPEREKN